MTNPLEDISDPATLLAMVQDGVKCEKCRGEGVVDHWYAMDDLGKKDCPVCNGTGHTPLPNADLDALAAKWCEDRNVTTGPGGIKVVDRKPYKPTTSPDAAMRLQEKYRISLCPRGETMWWARCGIENTPIIASESKCQAITTASLVAALTEAIQGASK